MKKQSFLYLALTAALAMAPAAQAQLTINDANASLDINGVQPSVSDPVAHTVAVNTAQPSNLDIHINSGANADAGFALLASGLPITGPQLATSWGDSIDVGGAGLSGVNLVMDGIGNTGNPLLDPFAATNGSGDFDLVVTTPLFLTGASVAVQAIVSDPTAMPFPFDNTEAGDMVFAVGAVTTSYTLADDGNVQHTLITPINLGGMVFNDVFMNSNGYITFVAGSGDFSETMGEFFNGWNTPGNAGVALAYSDLNRMGTMSGATYDVVEAPNGMVECQFNSQNWWGANASSAGNFKAIFNDPTQPAGTVILDLSGLTPDPTNTDDFIVGVTDGDDAAVSGMGTDTDLSDGTNTGFTNALAAGGYTSPSGMDSVGELFSSALAGPGGANPPATLTFLELGLGFNWFIF